MSARHSTVAIAVLALLALPSLAEPSRDPFTPYEAPQIAAGEGPLQRWPLEQLRVRGVVSATAAPRALIEGPDGVSHLARVGDPIGTAWGRIAAITPSAIAVVERYRDPIGGVHERRAELALPRAAATAGSRPSRAAGARVR